jgi:hypothetical protein
MLRDLPRSRLIEVVCDCCNQILSRSWEIQTGTSSHHVLQVTVYVALPMRSEERLPYWHFVSAREFFQPRELRNRGIQSKGVVSMRRLNQYLQMALRIPLFLASGKLDLYTHMFLAFDDSPEQFLFLIQQSDKVDSPCPSLCLVVTYFFRIRPTTGFTKPTKGPMSFPGTFYQVQGSLVYLSPLCTVQLSGFGRPNGRSWSARGVRLHESGRYSSHQLRRPMRG